MATATQNRETPLYLNDLNIDTDNLTYRFRLSKRPYAIQDTVRDMIKTINEDRLDPFVRQKAIEITKNIADRDARGMIQAIYDYLQNNIRYVEDPRDIEFMQHTKRLLTVTRAGDCDDFTIAGCSLMLSLNIDAKIKVVGTEKADSFNHVYAIANTGKEWIAFDPIWRNGINKRYLGQEPDRIKVSKIIPISTMSEFLTGTKLSSLAIILNGNGKYMINEPIIKLSGDIDFYNGLYKTVSGLAGSVIRKSQEGLLGSYSPQNTQAQMFFESAPQFENVYELPQGLVESAINNPDTVNTYIITNGQPNQVAYVDILSKNPELMGDILSTMLDSYNSRVMGNGLMGDNLAGNFWGNLWNGIKSIGSKVLSFIPGVGGILSKGLEMLPSAKTTSTPKKQTQPQPTRNVTQTQQPQVQQQQPLQQVTSFLPQMMQYIPQNFQSGLQSMLQNAQGVLQNPYVSQAMSLIPNANNVMQGIQNASDTISQMIPQQQFSGYLGKTTPARNRTTSKQTSKANPLLKLPFINQFMPFQSRKQNTQMSRDIKNAVSNIAKDSKTNVSQKTQEQLRLADNLTKQNQQRDAQVKELQRKITQLTKEKTELSNKNKKEVIELRKQLDREKKLLIEKHDKEMKENFIVSYRLWDELPEKTREKITNELKAQYGITPNFSMSKIIKKEGDSEVSKLFDNKLQQLDKREEEIKNREAKINDRVEQLKQEILQTKLLIESLKEDKLDGDLTTQEDERLNKELEELENTLRTQKDELKKVQNIKNSAYLKSLVANIQDLKKNIEKQEIKALDKDVENTKKLEESQQKLNELNTKLEEIIKKQNTTIESIQKERDDTIEKIRQKEIQIQQAQKDYEAKIEEKQKELEKVKQEKVALLDTQKQAQDKAIIEQQKKQIEIDYEKLVQDLQTEAIIKETKLNNQIKRLRQLVDSARALYKLLPVDANKVIRQFEKEKINLAIPDASAMKKLYSLYTKVLFENQEFQKNVDEKTKSLLVAIKNKYIELDFDMYATKRFLNIIKNLFSFNKFDNLRNHFVDLKNRFKALEERRLQFETTKDRMELDSLYTSSKNLYKDVVKFFKVLMTQIKSITGATDYVTNNPSVTDIEPLPEEKDDTITEDKTTAVKETIVIETPTVKQEKTSIAFYY